MGLEPFTIFEHTSLRARPLYEFLIGHTWQKDYLCSSLRLCGVGSRWRELGFDVEV